jgi:antitoxin ParD1/3/4
MSAAWRRQFCQSGCCEYFRGLLREAQVREQDARLEALLLEGLASKRIPLDAEFRKRLQAKVEQVLDKYSRLRQPSC